VSPFRRKRSWQRRVTDAARNAPQKGRELRDAAAQLDLPWARSAPARFVRERFMQFVLNPVMDYYAARRATGRETLSAIKQPVILVANHASHMDTPVILSALPRRLRKRTAVAAAADYFYRNRFVASIVSLIFNTVPIDRKGGGGMAKNGSHLDSLLDQGWSLLLYPEGTRARGGETGRVRRGAAVLAAAHNLSIIPIRVTGTADAMPPGRLWPQRLRGRLVSRRHRITVCFGEPIPPNGGDTAALIERVQSFFDNHGDGGPSRSPYRRSPKNQAAKAAPVPNGTNGATVAKSLNGQARQVNGRAAGDQATTGLS
jgi:1-acyl-sn-glycerol-3-phosphate acyltransferase